MDGLVDSDNEAEQTSPAKRSAGSRAGDADVDDLRDSDEESSGAEEASSVPAKRKRARNQLLDEEAEESGVEEGQEDDESEGGDEYEMDEFVAEDDEEEEESRHSVRKKPRQQLSRLRRHKEPVLDVEDIELVKENLGIAEPTYEEELERERHRNTHEQEKIRAASAADLANRLFDGDEEDARGPAERSRRADVIQDEEYDSDDLADFIEDDAYVDDDAAGPAVPIPRGRSRVRGELMQEIEDAREIFGDGAIDFFGFGEDAGLTDLAPAADKEQRTATRAAVRGTFEPAELIENFCTVADDTLRSTDRPERYQLRLIGRGEISDAERHEEAVWILERLAEKRASSKTSTGVGAQQSWAPSTGGAGGSAGWTSGGDAAQSGGWASSSATPAAAPSNGWSASAATADQASGWGSATTATAASGGWGDSSSGAADGGWGGSQTQPAAAAASDGGWGTSAATSSAGAGGWGSEQAQAFSSAGGWGSASAPAPAPAPAPAIAVAAAAAPPAETTSSSTVSELQAVITVLEFIQKDNFEVPFIWTYRRDYLAPSMTNADLWAILELDEKWEALQRARQGMLEKFYRVEQLCAGASGERAGEAELAEKQAQLDELKGELDATRQLAVYTDGRDPEEVQQAEARAEELEAQLAALQSELEDSARATQSQAQWGGDGQRLTRQQELAQLLNPRMYEEQLRGMADEKKLNDLKEYMSLILYASEERSKRTRRVQRLDRELYRRIRKQGLREFTNQFAVSAATLAEAVDHNKMQQEPPTPSQYPDMLALEYTDTTDFQTSDQVLAAARHMLAVEIANEPTLKSVARAFFNKKATVSTKPTPKGLEEITPLHELFGLHYLDRKPAQDFFYEDDRTLFAKLRKAQQDGFLTIALNIPATRQDRIDPSTGEIVDHWEPDIDGLREKFERFYQPSTPETVADDPHIRHSWDEERRKILDDAIVRHMFPALKAELLRQLAQTAREAVIDEVTANFQKLLSVGRAYKPTITRHELLTASTDVSLQPSLVVVYVGDEANDATYLVHLTNRGIVTAHHIIPKTTRERRKNELRDFLKSSRPDAIVVNTSWQGRSTMHLLNHEVIAEVRSGLERDVRMQQEQGQLSLHLDEDELEAVRNYNPPVLICKDEAAALVASTPRCRQAFPDFQEDMRTAVCLGRYVLDPLNVLSALWAHADPSGAFGRDLLFLNLHPLQGVVKQDSQLLRRFEERLIDAVNAAGVDLNAAVTYDHIAPTLTFVSGLGPRKGHALRQKIIVQGGSVKSRAELLERKLLQTNVYTNAAGFLRVQPLDAEQTDGYDPFDATRIHPECYVTYEWAQKICADALEDSYSGSNYAEIVEQLHRHISRVLAKTLRDKPHWHPDTAGTEDELKDKVYDLDLDAYAGVLEEQGAGKRRLQLYQIKMELRFPFLDRRQPFTNPTPEEQFTLFTGEDDNTIFKGLKVYATVQSLQPRKANVRLEGGLRGFIPIRLVEDQMTHDISAVLQEGQVVQCVVQRVFKDTINVELSCRPSDLAIAEEQWLEELERKFDPRFRKDLALEEYHKVLNRKEEQAQRVAAATGAVRMDIAGHETQPAQKKYTRQSFHPAFRNCRADQAEQELDGQGAGEVIFRPSSRAPDILVITWAFQDGCYKHIDVKEHDKLNPVQIGRRLEIDGEMYEGLDEIMARYISPMNDFVEMMTSDRKFFNGTREQVEAQLKQEKAEDKTRIPYYVWIDPRKPGYFVISFIRNVSVQHMIVAVTPSGYRLENRTAESPSELIKIFKEVASRTTSSRAQPQNAAPQGRLRTTSRWSNATPAAPQQQPPPPPPHQAYHHAPPPPQPPMSVGWGAPGANTWGGGNSWAAPPPAHASHPPSGGWGR